MRKYDPFNHIGGKGARFSEKDSLQYSEWSAQKIALFTFLLSLPYIALAIFLYISGLEMLAILLMGLLVIFLLIGFFMKEKLLK